MNYRVPFCRVYVLLLSMPLLRTQIFFNLAPQQTALSVTALLCHECWVSVSVDTSGCYRLTSTGKEAPDGALEPPLRRKLPPHEGPQGAASSALSCSFPYPGGEVELRSLPRHLPVPPARPWCPFKSTVMRTMTAITSPILLDITSETQQAMLERLADETRPRVQPRPSRPLPRPQLQPVSAVTQHPHRLPPPPPHQHRQHQDSTTTTITRHRPDQEQERNYQLSSSEVLAVANSSTIPVVAGDQHRISKVSSKTAADHSLFAITHVFDWCKCNVMKLFIMY